MQGSSYPNPERKRRAVLSRATGGRSSRHRRSTKDTAPRSRFHECVRVKGGIFRRTMMSKLPFVLSLGKPNGRSRRGHMRLVRGRPILGGRSFKTKRDARALPNHHPVSSTQPLIDSPPSRSSSIFLSPGGRIGRRRSATRASAGAEGKGVHPCDGRLTPWRHRHSTPAPFLLLAGSAKLRGFGGRAPKSP
jgi:hypothetical protein